MYNNPHPLANPYNTRFSGNFNINSQMSRQCYFNRTSSPQDLQVPDTKPFSMADRDFWDGVKVPCQNQIPMGCEDTSMYVDPSRYFKCPDGTIIDLSSRKVINHNEPRNGYWSEPTKKIDIEKQWDDREIYSFNPENPSCGFVSKEDQAYWDYAEKKSSELLGNMSDEQRNLLRQVELGRFNTKSKLVMEL